jgi:hypothetical protein
MKIVVEDVALKLRSTYNVSSLSELQTQIHDREGTDQFALYSGAAAIQSDEQLLRVADTDSAVTLRYTLSGGCGTYSVNGAPEGWCLLGVCCTNGCKRCWICGLQLWGERS